MRRRILVAALWAAEVLFAAGRVACVGNSITYGYDIVTWPDTTTYPHHLQLFLRAEGSADTVGNFGVSGLTVRKDDNSSYWNGYQFSPALSFAADTLIIELGTNDSKNYTSWNSAEQNAKYDAEIQTDFESMIDTFRTASNPRIFICLAPYANNSSWGIFDTAIVNHVIPAALRAAIEKGVNVIDLHAKFSYLENPDWYLSDTVHPSVAGAGHLAAIVYSHLKRDNLSVSQNQNELVAPEAHGYQWYKDGLKLVGENGRTLTVSELGEYAVSVKIEADAESRIVTRPYPVSDLENVDPVSSSSSLSLSSAAASSSSSSDATALESADRLVSFVRYRNGTLVVSLSRAGFASLKISDVQGRVLKSRELFGKAGENVISLSGFPAGRYVAFVCGKSWIFRVR